MLKKFTMCIKNLFKKLIEKLESGVPGYLAHCQDCGHIKRVTFLKDTQRFLCRNCINRYAKLYIKMNKIESGEKIGQIGQVV
jgi:uncharacterized Zn finger protein